VGKLGAALVAIAILIAGLAYREKREAEQQKVEAELNLGLDSAKMINISFAKKADLNVYQLSGDVVAANECEGRLFHPTQRTKAPVTVSYLIDLGAIDASSYGWNADRKLLTISVPDVRIEKPNVDMSKQVVRQDGIFISRECGLALTRKAQTNLSNKASAEARKPQNMMAAREAARVAVLNLANGILKGGRISDVRVAVSFAGERPKAVSDERWDETRPLVEVLANTTG